MTGLNSSATQCRTNKSSEAPENRHFLRLMPCVSRGERAADELLRSFLIRHAFIQDAGVPSEPRRIDLGHDFAIAVTVAAQPILLADLTQPDQIPEFSSAKRQPGIGFGN